MPPIDKFGVASPDPTQPASTVRLITPSDDTDLPVVARAFQVRGTAGDVEVVTRDGDTVVVPSVAVGERIECYITRIRASNTTATVIMTYE